MSNIIKITGIMLAVMLAGHYAQATEATVITLSCDGTSQLMGASTNTPEPANKVGLVVNLADNTVTGFGVVACIDRTDAASISFSGEGPLSLHGARFGTISLTGEMDRVTGAVSVLTGTSSLRDNKVMSSYTYDLVCKVTNRLF